MTINKKYLEIPTTCPCCGNNIILKNDHGTEFLFCENDLCPAKTLSQFIHFTSRQCMDIEGLSEATLEKFINLGYISQFRDIYKLSRFKEQIINLEGFGEKSYNNLISAIEKSRNISLDRVILSMEIPQIGAVASKTLAKYFKTMDNFLNAIKNNFDFTQLPDFGPAVIETFKNFKPTVENNFKNTLLENLLEELNIIEENIPEVKSNNFITNRIFVVTGAFNRMPRSELEKLITENGGKLAGSVSKKTDFLLTNDKNSGSSKNLKAQELGIPIMSEDEFFENANL